MVLADPQRIVQVLSNILTNAIRPTPSGGKIAVSAARHLEDIEVVISDSGEGIPGDQLLRIFDRFYRVDPSRSRETGGSGLGLTIARLLVESHGGKIAAGNNATGGSWFCFLLPVAR